MKRFTFLAIIIFSLVAAPAAVAEDASAEAASILRAAAEYSRPMYRIFYGRILYLFAEMNTGRGFEEDEVLKRLADSERGKEVVAAACREALASDDLELKLIAFYFLSDIEGAEADAYIPDLYDGLGEGDVVVLTEVASDVLDPAPDEVRAGASEELYARLARDLAGDDRAARLKAAKLIAFTESERARALAARGMQSPDADVRRWCLFNLCGGYWDWPWEPSRSEALVAALDDEDPRVRAYAARRLADAGDAKFIPPLLALLEDGDVSVRRAAAHSVASLLGYEPAADKGVAKKLLKRLKAEGDGVTRCFLARAYGAAMREEAYGKDLTDDGYWAFFAGEWREEDLESYYVYSGVGGVRLLLEEAPEPGEPPVWEIPAEEVARPEEAEEAPGLEKPVYHPNERENLRMLDDVLGAAEETLGWDDVFCATSLDKSVDLFEELQPAYAPGTRDRTFIDDAIVTLGNIKTWVEERIDEGEGIDPTGADAIDKKMQIHTIRYWVNVMVIKKIREEGEKKMREEGEILKRKWAERGKK